MRGSRATSPLDCSDSPLLLFWLSNSIGVSEGVFVVDCG